MRVARACGLHVPDVTIDYAPAGDSQNELLSQPLGDAIRFGQVTKAHIIALAERFGLKASIAEKEVKRLANQLNQAMDAEYQKLE